MNFFRVNSPTVIHEAIDGETVVVNLESGTYYSLNDSGSAVWDCVARGLGDGQIVDQLCARFSGDRGQIEAGVGQILGDMQREHLIIPASDSVVQEAPPSGAGTVLQQKAFMMPALQKYSDMEDLLLLDPIHDVADTGWPNRPAE